MWQVFDGLRSLVPVDMSLAAWPRQTSYGMTPALVWDAGYGRIAWCDPLASGDAEQHEEMDELHDGRGEVDWMRC